jgi:recombinational DNA repair protein (RecF pathway)
MSCSFTHRTNNSTHFNYQNGEILRTECAEDLSVMLASKLYFHQRVNYVSSKKLSF